MNKLLIHNDNVFNKTYFEFSIKFPPIENIDENISKNIIKKIENMDIDIIFIKDNLSSNYLELIGLRVAYHIRLSNELGDKKYLPIIIISDIDSYSLNKIDSMARILFTKNIFIVQNDKESIESFDTSRLKPLSQESYLSDFLSQIEVEAPKDYLSHHSITNEWAIDQWAYFLDVDKNEVILKNRQKISSMLFYKYIKSIFHLNNKSTNQNIKPKKYDGNILLIDDKSTDGWEDILSVFCEKYYTSINFSALKGIDKESSLSQIKDFVKSEIQAKNPDIVILDLRLLSMEGTVVDNYNNNDIKQNISNFSGFQIFREIQNINPSIQVIMFTASGDSLILDEFYNKGILGYVKKDSPYNKYQAPKNSFKKLDTLLRKALNRKYLKDIYNTQIKILNLDIFSSNKIKNNENFLLIQKTVSQIFEILNSDISYPFVYAMLTIFKCIELINALYIEEKKIDGQYKAVWKNGNIILTGYSTEDRILAILESLHVNNKKLTEHLHQIVCSRNFNIHGGKEKTYCKESLIKEPNETHIVVWFDMICTILIQIDNKT